VNSLKKILAIGILSINIYALDIVYEPRSPYVTQINDSISGLVATPLIKALDEAKITYNLKNQTSKKHLKEIERNQKEICAVGWFKNPKRELFGKYTKPLYQDKPMGIIVNHKSDIKNNTDISNLLKTNNYKVLIKDSYSYGKFLDDKLKNKKVKKTTTSNDKMASMIAKGRADFMFISYEEATSIMKNNKYKSKLQYISLKGMPEGNKRYLICSKKVSDRIIEQLNKYIK